MKSDYIVIEVMEIGGAQEVILGEKVGIDLDLDRPFPPSLDLDE